jgi:hypothetical protein
VDSLAQPVDSLVRLLASFGALHVSVKIFQVTYI